MASLLLGSLKKQTDMESKYFWPPYPLLSSFRDILSLFYKAFLHTTGQRKIAYSLRFPQVME